jgi:hypothetical protein
MNTLLKGNSSIIYWALGIAITLIAGSVFHFLWSSWTFVALAVSALYFFGLFSLTPWRKPWQKAISVGLFLGQAIALIIWLTHLK